MGRKTKYKPVKIITCPTCNGGGVVYADPVLQAKILKTNGHLGGR